MPDDITNELMKPWTPEQREAYLNEFELNLEHGDPPTEPANPTTPSNSQVLEKARWLDFPSGEPVGKVVLAESSAFCDSDWIRRKYSDAVGIMAVPPGLCAGLVINRAILSKKDKDELVKESTQVMPDEMQDDYKCFYDFLKHPELNSLLESQEELQNINNSNTFDSVRLSDIYTIRKNAAVAIAQRTVNDADSEMIERKLASDLIAQIDTATGVEDYASHWINKEKTRKENNIRSSLKRAATEMARRRRV